MTGRRRIALAAVLLVLSSNGCGRKQLGAIAPPAQRVPHQLTAADRDELKQALDRNLEEARAACQQYQTLCARAEALMGPQPSEQLTAQTAAALAGIAKQAQSVLDRLNQLATEQDDLAQQVLTRAGSELRG